MVKEEGFGALYQGLTPSLLGNGSAWGIYFLMYVIVQFFYYFGGKFCNLLSILVIMKQRNNGQVNIIQKLEMHLWNK